MITMTQRGRKAATNSGTPLLASLLAPVLAPVLALTLAGTALAGEAQHPDPPPPL